jgi:DNA-binding GntR family transcriptional regulator
MDSMAKLNETVNETPNGSGSRFPDVAAHPKIKDVILQSLREWIVFGDARPGDRLVETDLAARFNVSKTPVREALLTLAAEGLVILRPHRGGVVAPLSETEWHDLIYLRDVLEVGALDDIVAGITEAHFQEAERCVAEMQTAFDAGDYRRYRQAQRRLHATILGVPGHPSLPETAVQLNDRLDRYGRILTTRDPGSWARDLDMNRQRLELIRQRDTATYARLIRGRHAEATQILTEVVGINSSSDGDADQGGATS